MHIVQREAERLNLGLVNRLFELGRCTWLLYKAMRSSR